MELSQVRLIVRDFTRCYRFYRDVLGLLPQFDAEQGPYAKFELPAGNAGSALHSRTDFEKTIAPLESEGGVRALVVLHVADVDATVREWILRGAALEHQPRDVWGRLRVAYVKDPEGNLIELQQWLLAQPKS
jgi:catechol 2,3-dioxygenase-like lactoylglutathione lyase family enzyme